MRKKERTGEAADAQRLADIGSLAGIVAHELRNPLGVIQIAAYNIAKRCDDPALKRHMANIERKIEESDRVIDNLLRYSRLKMPDPETVRLRDLLLERISLAGKRFARRQVRVIRKLQPVRHSTITADPRQIGEVLDNILTNAYEALPEKKGRIEIRAGISRKGVVAVHVADNGAGMSDEDREKAFEPFFTRKSRGSGLGLTICREIVRLHGGNITIESTEGRGTTVSVYLPLGKRL